MASDKAQKENKGRSGQMAAMRQVLRYIRRYWFMVGFSLVLAAVTVVLTLYVPILTGLCVMRICLLMKMKLRIC